jgi:hypothetical protein
MISDEELVQIVAADRSIFEKLLRDITYSPESRKLNCAKKAVLFACRSSTNYLSSPVIEAACLEIAENLQNTEGNETVEENSTLHVMTECYHTGGHTRVVERWIELSENEQHSLIFTSNTDQTVPPKLSSVIEASGGYVFKLKESLSDIQKALELRQVASRFQRIILHIHMHDLIPLLAFGTNKFERPVIVYNHADHLFWVGVSIADLVLETRHWGHLRSVHHRGVKKSVVVGIPNDYSINVQNASRTQILEAIGIDSNKKVILTAGSPHKYMKFGRWDFLLALQHILEENTDAVLIFVGPHPYELHNWRSFEKRFPTRIFALGFKMPSELHRLMMASDLYIDSFPMSGGTTLSDAVMAGVPCLSMESVTGHLDFTLHTKSYCKSISELQEKASEILQNIHLAEGYKNNLKRALLKSNGKDVWKEQIKAVYDQLPSKHSVNHFNSTPESDDCELALYTVLFHRQKKCILFVPRFFSIYHSNHRNRRRFIIKFNFF